MRILVQSGGRDQRSKNGIFTVMASLGQSISQAKQYQHSSKAMLALPVSGSTAKQSTGHESIQMRQPVMHLFRSTTTGTSKRRSVCALPTRLACAAFTVSRSFNSLTGYSLVHSRHMLEIRRKVRSL